MEKNIELTGEILYNGNLHKNCDIVHSVVRFKRYVLQNKHICDADVVAIYLDKSLELMIAICALFELGIPFLMLGKELPSNRIEFMLNKTKTTAILTSSEYVQHFDNKKVVCVDKLINNHEMYADKISYGYKLKNIESDIAYILFTSGSTGEPKAVQVKRSGLINFMQSVPNIVSINKDTIIGCFTNCTFDIFFLESLVALYSGARVVVGDNESCNNVKLLMRTIVESNINMLQFTPSRLRMIQMMDPKFECLKNIKVLLVGGESLSEEMLKTLKQNTSAKIYNMYGPTETTIWSTISNLTNADSVDIGYPINNTEIYILNLEKVEKGIMELSQECGGEVGEICIAGAGLAKGYLDNEELTQKAFVYIAQGTNMMRIYRTGDLGYYRQDGKLICLGRLDNQIKYNGHRIELDEIEENIFKYNLVLNTAVCFDAEYNRLIAFVVVKNTGEAFRKEIIDEILSSNLPNYMCPSEYVVIDNLLYTVSGKLDRNGLLKSFKEKIKIVNEEDSSIKDSGNKILEEVIERIAKITGKSKNELNVMSKVDEILDSIQFVNIVVGIEVIFDIEFSDEKLSLLQFDTIGDICEYIESLIEENSI